MRNVEKKAARLVGQGAVRVDYWRVNQDRIVYAAGTVTGQHGKYVVTLEPDRDTCDCQHGMNQPNRPCSHTVAMRLAVWQLVKIEVEDRRYDART